MRSTPPRADNWRDRLPPYGQTVDPPPTPPTQIVREVEVRRRPRVGGWLLALGVGAAVAALVIYNQNDPRTIGMQLDQAVSNVRGIGTEVGQTVVDSQAAAVDASRNALDGVSTAIDDGAISLKVKTALAADPALSAPRITVTTEQGIVRLDGPAPDATSKERATVLASAPNGVRGVDNRLTLPQAGNVVAVADAQPRPAAETVPATTGR